MSELEQQILKFIQNRNEIGETTAIRHIHRRFSLNEEEIEKIIKNLLDQDLIRKFLDSDYDELRYSPQITDS